MQDTYGAVCEENRDFIFVNGDLFVQYVCQKADETCNGPVRCSKYGAACETHEDAVYYAGFFGREMCTTCFYDREVGAPCGLPCV